MQDEYKRRKKQLQDLCHAVKAESVADLQDILCCMVLSECVYKVNLISTTKCLMECSLLAFEFS